MDYQGPDYTGMHEDSVKSNLEVVLGEMQENIRILAANQETMETQIHKLRDAILELGEAHEIVVDNLLELTVEVGMRLQKKDKKKKKKEK